jgi:hypothetical protein
MPHVTAESESETETVIAVAPFDTEDPLYYPSEEDNKVVEEEHHPDTTALSSESEGDDDDTLDSDDFDLHDVEAAAAAAAAVATGEVDGESPVPSYLPYGGEASAIHVIHDHVGYGQDHQDSMRMVTVNHHHHHQHHEQHQLATDYSYSYSYEASPSSSSPVDHPELQQHQSPYHQLYYPSASIGLKWAYSFTAPPAAGGLHHVGLSEVIEAS